MVKFLSLWEMSPDINKMTCLMQEDSLNETGPRLRGPVPFPQPTKNTDP